jgi:hypothetical protein
VPIAALRPDTAAGLSGPASRSPSSCSLASTAPTSVTALCPMHEDEEAWNDPAHDGPDVLPVGR